MNKIDIVSNKYAVEWMQVRYVHQVLSVITKPSNIFFFLSKLNFLTLVTNIKMMERKRFFITLMNTCSIFFWDRIREPVAFSGREKISILN